MLKKGFTLAEILITLSIIGVVAALTLPSVIQNNKKKAVETKLAKFYSIMNQALQQSIVENGDMVYWDDYSKYGSSFDISKYIYPYLKGEQISKNDYIYFRFSDGSIVYGKRPYIFYFISAKNIEDDIEKINSNPLGPNEDLGKRIFVFLTPRPTQSVKFVTPVDQINKPDVHIGMCGQSIYDPNGEYGHFGCAAVIMKNGWKIPKNYPVKL